MTNDFRQQLNSASRDKNEVLSEQNQRMISDCRQRAKSEYYNLKEHLLDQVSKGNYVQSEDKKALTYLYNPIYIPCNYIFDNGIRSETKGLFRRKLKVVNTGVKQYMPKEPDKWNYYIEELKRLGNQDNISIDAVMCSDYYDNLMYSFPTIINDKKFILSARLCLKCYVEF